MRATVEKYTPLATATFVLAVIVAAMGFLGKYSDDRVACATQNGEQSAKISGLSTRIDHVEGRVEKVEGRDNRVDRVLDYLEGGDTKSSRKGK